LITLSKTQPASYHIAARSPARHEHPQPFEFNNMHVGTGVRSMFNTLAFLAAIISVGSAIGPPAHTDVPPPALPTGCFLNSVVNPLWQVSQLQYTDTAIKLVIANPADESVFHCVGATDGSSGVIHPTCETSSGGVGNVTVEFIPHTHTLEIEQTWVCTDNQKHIP
jgi:hypothetical protein